MIKVAINGFGRIGRLAFREMITGVDFDIVAINDLTDAETLAYLLKYDTNHRTFHEDKISYENDEIIINGKKRIKVYAEKDPSNLPWAYLGNTSRQELKKLLSLLHQKVMLRQLFIMLMKVY